MPHFAAFSELFAEPGLLPQQHAELALLLHHQP